MSAESVRYARITHRLALGVSSAGDVESQAMAQLLQRRIVETIVAECAPYVTSDLLSQRLAQAVVALSEHGIALRVTDAGVAVDSCVCQSDGCGHPEALLARLLGVAVEPIITRDGTHVLQVLGVVDAAS